MSNTKELQYADSALQNPSYVIDLEGVACDTSEAAVEYSCVSVCIYYTKAETLLKGLLPLEGSLSVLERSLVGKLTYFIYS